MSIDGIGLDYIQFINNKAHFNIMKQFFGKAIFFCNFIFQILRKSGDVIKDCTTAHICN